jgi:agmatinase
VIVDVLGTLVSHGKMGAHRHIIDKPISVPAGPDVDGQGWGTRP